MNETETVLLILPCPNCQENILKKGFYNSCSETATLREDNSATMMNGRLHLDHDEDDHETQSHECDEDAYCSSCYTLLPWPLYEIRELDYKTMADAEKLIAELTAEIEPEDNDAPETEEV